MPHVSLPAARMWGGSLHQRRWISGRNRLLVEGVPVTVGDAVAVTLGEAVTVGVLVAVGVAVCVAVAVGVGVVTTAGHDCTATSSMYHP
jgi:hypothetical protein